MLATCCRSPLISEIIVIVSEFFFMSTLPITTAVARPATTRAATPVAASVVASVAAAIARWAIAILDHLAVSIAKVAPCFGFRFVSIPPPLAATAPAAVPPRSAAIASRFSPRRGGIAACGDIGPEVLKSSIALNLCTFFSVLFCWQFVAAVHGGEVVDKDVLDGRLLTWRVSGRS